MPSEFVDHFTQALSIPTSRPNSPTPPSPYFQPETSLESEYLVAETRGSQSLRKPALHELLVTLNQGSIHVGVQRYIRRFRDIPQGLHNVDENAYLEAETDSEVIALEDAIVGKLTVALYADALDTYLEQATQVEAEAEWWADIEGSRISVALYLLQTFPIRIFNLLKVVVHTLRAHQMPVTFSSLSPSSLRSLFPSPSGSSLRPGLLTTTFFPHLRNQQSLSLMLLPPSRDLSTSSDTSQISILERLISLFRQGDYFTPLIRVFELPLELTRQECRHNRKALEQIRDQRAEVLGELAQLRSPLGGLMGGTRASTVAINGRNLSTKKYTSFLDTLSHVLTTKANTEQAILYSSSSPIAPLEDISQIISSLVPIHAQLLQNQRLLRPSRLTRLWPSLLVLPPVSLYIYSTTTSWVPALIQMAKDARETIQGFIEGWLVEPLVGVLKTVRAGARGEMLVKEEGILADIESLQRMTLSLARDTLNYTPSQLETLAEQVRMGDLTPVMEVYEADIRTPLRSALTGTLLRNAFIQVQKAKVDIDQALAGIDRLLKSQELTFAFVGVAPALAIVYAVFGGLGRLWSGGSGKGRWGGRHRRKGVWEGMRRIERLLIKQPATPPSTNTSVATLPKDTSAVPLAALPTGLLLLSLTRLRSYALNYLPADLRKPFLEDLDDLEDPTLGKEAKLKVVERMWRCWGAGGEGVMKL